MKFALQKKENAGFAVIEATLAIIIIAAILGLGLYVMKQRNTSSSINSTSSALVPQAQAGTTASIGQLTQIDAQNEAGVDSSGDNQTQQNVSSADSAISNVGGAYDETTL